MKGWEFSFTEIAKTVGERWQVLPPDEKATYESRSQAMKDKYYAHLAEYKKTQEYTDYQKYLAEFKAKHESKEGTRSCNSVCSLGWLTDWQTTSARERIATRVKPDV